MPPEFHIAFLGTSRSGLGHLRRISNIATQIAHRSPRARMSLITNANPGGLGPEDLAPFADIQVRETANMVAALVAAQASLAVADTMTLPGIGAFDGQAALILRETPQPRLSRFLRDDGAAWDLVLVPNAADHWWPDLPPGFARKVEAAGWIRRAVGRRAPYEPSAGIVLATGGGGNDQTRAVLYPVLEAIVARARALSKGGFRLRQALGPRASGQALPGVDEVFDPGPALHRVFRAADVVISTAGYNSVLELAETDTPALLVPIPRSLDDQAARVAQWGARLGFGMTDGADGAEGPGEQVEAAARWLAGQIDCPLRRPVCDLGPDGAARAADILLEMACPVS